MARSDRERRFDIRIWFVVTSLAVILAITVSLALTLSRYVARRVLLREGEVAQEFLESILRAEGTEASLFAAPAPSPALVSFATHALNLQGIVRANVYDLDGTIRHSSDPGLIGLRFADNDELEEAFEGKLAVGLERAADDDKAEHLRLDGSGGELIEAYIPVRGSDGRLLCVVEFYKQPAVVRRIIADIDLIIWLAAAIGGTVLFVTLYGIVARGARLIDQQQQEIAGMAALAALGQLAGAIAHSLRNPLANIRSTAELLQHQHPTIAGPAAAEIDGQVERMNSHVRELLEYAEADSASSQTIALADLVRDTLAGEQARLERHGIALAIEEPPPGSGLVSVDPLLLAQALRSLVANAVEAMPEGGRLTVAVAAEAGARKVRVTVTDTGVGIAKDLLARLPAPFVTSKTRGLGLGLTLAKRIVERFGGALRIASEVGTGTTVTLELPRAA